MTSSRRSHGFTLIELIVVIAVIAILAGIMISVIAGVIEKSRISRAIGEFRNFATALDKINAEVGFYPPEVVENKDPGLVTNPFASTTHPLYKKWAGPYIKVWPTLTPWAGYWDYGYGADSTIFNQDNLSGNEVSMAQVKGNVAAAMSLSAAEGIDASLDTGNGSAAGPIQWSVDGLTGAVNRLTFYVAEGQKWW